MFGFRPLLQCSCDLVMGPQTAATSGTPSLPGITKAVQVRGGSWGQARFRGAGGRGGVSTRTRKTGAELAGTETGLRRSPAPKPLPLTMTWASHVPGAPPTPLEGDPSALDPNPSACRVGGDPVGRGQHQAMEGREDISAVLSSWSQPHGLV